jgi:hypothetical protein
MPSLHNVQSERIWWGEEDVLVCPHVSSPNYFTILYEILYWNVLNECCQANFVFNDFNLIHPQFKKFQTEFIYFLNRLILIYFRDWTLQATVCFTLRPISRRKDHPVLDRMRESNHGRPDHSQSLNWGKTYNSSRPCRSNYTSDLKENRWRNYCLYKVKYQRNKYPYFSSLNLFRSFKLTPPPPTPNLRFVVFEAAPTACNFVD